MKTKYFLCFLFLFMAKIGFAQTGVYVTYYSGSTQGFNVETSGKLYFDSDNLYVKNNDAATPTTIPVSIIRKIVFSNTLATEAFGENKYNMALYPNPGNDYIKIYSEKDEDLSVTIYTLNGQLLHSGKYTVNQDIDVTSLAQGLYLIQANGVTFKFCKK